MKTAVAPYSPTPHSRQLAEAALYLPHREQKDSSFLWWSSRQLRYFTNPTSWEKCQNVLKTLKTFMLLSWWCPLVAGKGHWPARQFIKMDRLIPVFFDLPPFSLDSTFNSCPVNMLQTLISLYCLCFPGLPVLWHANYPCHAHAHVHPFLQTYMYACLLTARSGQPKKNRIVMWCPTGYQLVFMSYSIQLHLPPVRFHCVGGLNQEPVCNCKPDKEPRNRFPTWRNRFLGFLNFYKYGLSNVGTFALVVRDALITCLDLFSTWLDLIPNSAP